MTKETEKALNKVFSHSKEEGAQALLEHLLKQPELQYTQLHGGEPDEIEADILRVNSVVFRIQIRLRRELGMEADD